MIDLGTPNLEMMWLNTKKHCSLDIIEKARHILCPYGEIIDNCNNVIMANDRG